MSFQWFGEEAIRRLQQHAADCVSSAAMQLARHAKQKIGEVGKASAPGEYPFKQSGHLRRNVEYEVDRDIGIARWGTNVIYGKYLELGTDPHTVTVKSAKVLANQKTGQVFGRSVTVSMKPRPWMSKTNAEMASEVKQILSRKME